MPYASQAQSRYFNSQSGKAKVGATTVAEFNKASKGMKLPKKVGAVKAARKAAKVPASGKTTIGDMMENLVG